MAITDFSGLTINAPQVGIQISKVTDSSADWSGVLNSTYFYDKTDKLVHYKDSTGTVQELFSSGGNITVGTTPITSGTDGRVFFQAGGVVQQDANFTFDNTLKRLTLKAVSTGAGDIPFAVQNSAGTANLMQVAGDNTMTFLSLGNIGFSSSDAGGNIKIKRNFSSQTMIELGGGDNAFVSVNPINIPSYIALGSSANGASINWDVTNFHFQIKNSFHNLFDVVGNPNSATATFRLGTIASNTNFFNIHGRNSGGTGLTTNPIFTINSSGTVGIGTEASTPSARLDVRAADGLSNPVFRVRNSADTANLASIAGNGDISLGEGATGVTVTSYPFISIGSSAKASQYGVSIGTNAGKNQSNGDLRNVYIGTDVAFTGTNQTASSNIGIGNNVFYAITTGSRNVSIGGSASNASSRFLTSASDCVFIGDGAGNNVTTGGTNTCIGSLSGTQNVSGTSNTQIGYSVDQGVGTNKSHITAIGMRLRSSHNGVIMLGSSGNTATIAPSIVDDAAQFHFRSDLQSFFFNKNTNVVLKSNSSLTSGTNFDANATNTFTIHNGTAPSTNIANAFQQYSASVTAGNAAPHFRTENGSIIKLYQNAAVTNSQGVADALTNLGLLATSVIDFIPVPDAYEIFRGRTFRYDSTTVDTYAGIATLNNASSLGQITGTTNFYQKFVRLRYYRTTVSTGIMTSVRSTDLQWYVGGGFRFVTTFRVSDTAFSSNCQQFYGLAGTTAELVYGGVSQVLVRTNLNIIGVGSDNGDTNLQIFYNDASGNDASKIDLGVNFPANRTAGDVMTTMYSIQIYNEVNSSQVKYEVINLETGAIAQGTLTTDLPAATQGLSIHATRAAGSPITGTGQFELHKWGCSDIIK